jgi:hypothetical protein
MIRESEVVQPREALKRILAIMSPYSSFTAADREIIRAANRGLLGTDPRGRWGIDTLSEEEQTDPTYYARKCS